MFGFLVYYLPVVLALVRKPKDSIPEAFLDPVQSACECDNMLGFGQAKICQRSIYQA